MRGVCRLRPSDWVSLQAVSVPYTEVRGATACFGTCVRGMRRPSFEAVCASAQLTNPDRKEGAQNPGRKSGGHSPARKCTVEGYRFGDQTSLSGGPEDSKGKAKLEERARCAV